MNDSFNPSSKFKKFKNFQIKIKKKYLKLKKFQIFKTEKISNF